MKKFLFGAALLLLASSAFAAETIKAKVGHMCCGACKAGATAGVKKLDWVDAIAIDADTITVTAKGDQPVDLIGLMDALNKAGFPANEILVSQPIKLNVSHLCCASCTADLKAKLAELRSMVLDKDKTVIDQGAKTVVLAPVAGKSLNVVPLLHQMERAGFGASKGIVVASK